MEDSGSENKKICAVCGSDKTYTRKTGKRKGRKEWRILNEKYCCHTCYQRLIINPKHAKKLDRKRSAKRIVFKGKRLRLKIYPRKGICQNLFCVNPIYKQTHLHHKQYHDDDVLKDTIELCAHCHPKAMKRIKHFILSCVSVAKNQN